MKSAASVGQTSVGRSAVCRTVGYGLFVVSLLMSADVLRADWPTFRADPARSGYTSAKLPEQLHLQWTYRSSHKPVPAWPRSQRLEFDMAVQPIMASGSVYFGDSVEGTITALDQETGSIRWVFVTDGPIRFAPVAWQDRIFAISDDGWLYALSQQDGSLLWKKRGGPENSWRLGNERMISRWPSRGGPLVIGDILYYGTGIWPTDGIYLAALNADSGEPVWINDDSGSMYMAQPHGGANAESGVAVQGYLAAATTFPAAVGAANSEHVTPGEKHEKHWLVVPTGRAVPATFDRDSGKFEYFHLQKYGHKGGAAVVVADSLMFNSGTVFDMVSGEAVNTVGEGPVVATPGGLVRAADGKVTGYRWIDVEQKDRRGNPVMSKGLEPLWAADEVHAGSEMIVADTRAVVGGEGKVSVVDRGSSKVVWSAEVSGAARGLAVSDGRLLVSTTDGVIYCFGTTAQKQPATILAAEDSPAELQDPKFAEAAALILRRTGVIEGFCLDLGCGDGRLAMELAKQSQLQIVAVEADPVLLEQAKQRLRAARLLGSRVTVLHTGDLKDTGLPNYFANLVVSGRSVTEGADIVSESEVARTVRPWGGAAVLGKPDEQWSFVRGALEGAGNWTHQYSNAGNTLCSTDEHIKGPLGMLWFRDVEMNMPQRHGRGPGPLFFEGLLYSEGLDELACVDAYNGRVLWKYPLPGILSAFDGDELMGTAATHSNYCVAETGIYVRRDDYCLRIDRRTGELLNKFFAPRGNDGKGAPWGWIACEDGLLLGSAADPEHVVTFRYVNRGGNMNEQLSESRSLFALDAVSGEVKWKYDARNSIRHNAIAMGSGSVYLIDRQQALFDRSKTGKADAHPPGILVALDAATGDVRWTSEQQIDGTMLALSDNHATLLMSYQPTRFSLVSEVGGRLSAFDTANGSPRWQKQADYASRPLINDRTIYAQGGAWDLLTGETREFNFSRSYGCGVLAGSSHMMVFRSATLGYFDLLRNERTENFGGVRPGCWINAIPAGGIVLVPDASAGCKCSYLNQTWFALEPDGFRPPKMEPKGGAFGKPVEVRLTADQPDHVVRYTLDGSTPDSTSATAEQAILVVADTILKARGFDAEGRSGKIVEGRFVIDPAIVPVDSEYWKVWDISEGAIGAPSLWSAKDGVISQTSNIYQGSATDPDPAVERYGTFRIYQRGTDFGDGEIEFEFNATDDDSIGAAFRFADEKQHYLWSSDLQRSFSTLSVKNGSSYKVLATTDKAYQRDTWHRVRITMQGSQIAVWLDDKKLLEADDPTFASGTFALHTWGSDNTRFRSIRLRRATAP